MREFGLLVGRLLIGILFIAAGIGGIMQWENMMMLFHNTMDMWAQLIGPDSALTGSVQLIASLAELFVGVAIAFKLIGGLSVLTGYHCRIGALLLILFMVPVTVLFHAFWMVPEAQAALQQQMFLKNLAILGGLLYVLIIGKGRSEHYEG